MKLKHNLLVGAVALSLALYGTSTTARVSRFGSAMAAAAPGVSMKPDQVNTARWDRAWTNLVNDAEQSFTPSLPRLLGVEVELVVGNAGPSEDELTLTVMDAKGQIVAVVTQTVQASDCDPTMFVIPKDGIDVTPGRTYWLKLTGGTLFGWKYVVGGYENGVATFNEKPLLPKARSTFLFRTFGAE
ncbi:MAG: hypothetical protein WB781_22690 [Candidatus Sulfotelmatobacter sp.]